MRRRNEINGSYKKNPTRKHRDAEQRRQESQNDQAQEQDSLVELREELAGAKESLTTEREKIVHGHKKMEKKKPDCENREIQRGEASGTAIIEHRRTAAAAARGKVNPVKSATDASGLPGQDSHSHRNRR